MRFNTIDINACGDCLQLTANGEINDGENTARDCARGQRELWGDDVRHFVCGGGRDDDDGERGFSWSACEGCGNTYGGDRYQMHVMIPLEVIRTGRDGRMYVSSRDGSYVEVWKGTEHVSTITRGGSLRYPNARRLYAAS